MEIGQGQNWGCSAKENKNIIISKYFSDAFCIQSDLKQGNNLSPFFSNII
jgi:hypothetical protein